MKKIVMTVDPKTGKIEVETTGFKGKECIEETKWLEKAIGKAKQVKKKPEYYQKAAKKQENKRWTK